MTSKSASVPTWHQIGAEKRPMRKHTTKLAAPDVYAQDSRQEEDVLNPERLKKGYQYPATSHEHESLLFMAKSNKLEKLDDAHQKAFSLLATVMYRKGEFNAIEKERKKNRETLSMLMPNATAKDRAQWFTDLSRGKSLAQLAKKVPGFRNKAETYDYLCDYKITPYRALWVLKLYSAFANTQAPSQKGRRSNTEVSIEDPGPVLYQILQNLLIELWDCDDLNSSPLIEKWYYFTTLSKKSFDEGIVDKQNFVNELAEIFCLSFIRHKPDGKDENPELLRLYLTFFIQFMEEINMNLIVARRTAYMAALKISILVEEARQIALMNNSGQIPSDKSPTVKELLDMLMECRLQYPNIMLLSAILRSVVIDTPAALIWNEFKIENGRDPIILHHLCGSALDVLPCDILELPYPPGKDRDYLYQLVEMRVCEVVRRSQAVQDRWLSHQSEEYAYGQHFASLTESCLDVIGVMDSVNLFRPNIIQTICNRLFNFKSAFWNQEIVIRIKLLLQWAVTEQREGTHRAVIVAKILKQQILNQRSNVFGNGNVQDIILNYFMTEAPKTPKNQSVSSNSYYEEFGSAVVLFMELVQKGLFDHDTFVKNAIRVGDLDYHNSIMAKLEMEGKIQLNKIQEIKQQPIDMLQALKNTAENDGNDEAMLDSLPSPQKKKPVCLITYKEPEKDEHILLDEEIGMNERLLIQMPIRQKETFRAEANQRSLVLYGMTEQRDAHKNELKEVAKEICKIWKRKVYVQFNNNDENVWCPRRITNEKIKEALDKFKRQTYYDQVVICGWCAESFSEMIEEFVQGNSLQMPTSEGLDILCQMFEYANYYYGIFELCEAIIPLLNPAEKIVRSLAADCIPGSLSGQLGYVFVAYLSKHWHYFLHSDRAISITTLLYEMIERLLKADQFPMTGWGRVIGAFVFHARDHLVKSQMMEPPTWGQFGDFKKIFTHGTTLPTEPRRYNPPFFRDVFDSKVLLRFYSYHEYKKRLHSFDIAFNRYSFVINAIRVACQAGKDVDFLIELSSFCGHISAQIPSLAEEWITAFKVICSATSSHPSGGYSELFTEINLNDCSTHSSIATFASLLAGKYAFSTPRLVAQLLDSSLAPLMNKDSGRRRSTSDNEPGVCICLLILSNLCCSTDEPFLLSSHYTGDKPKNKLLNQTADEISLSLIHWCEMGKVLFPMISYMVIIMDNCRNRHKDLEFDLSSVTEGTTYKKEYLMNLLRAAQHIICEQEWVTDTMYRIITTNRMEALNHERLKMGSIGQQLLRMGIRRKSERNLVQELYVSNGGSKKALVDKLLSALTIWNFRATLFDLSLMIKEISPEGAQKHAQQGAMVADALMNEMGKCVRDMFTNAHKDMKQLPEGKSLSEFRFEHICKFWLIAPLVRLCPQPANVPQQFHSTSLAISGKFLKEASSMLDIASENTKERIQQSTWLLSQQPFINLILTCLKCEDEQQNKDALVSALFKQLQELVTKSKDNYAPICDKASAEREGLLLRLSLVGSIFTELYRLSTTENWCLLFFQIMFYGIIHPERERLLYDSCYDMLSTLMLWTLTDPDAIQQSTAPEGKFRWPTYLSIIKKLKKEIGDQRIPEELRGLFHFLPIPKCSMDVISAEQYGVVPVNANKQRYPRSSLTPPGLRRARWSLQPADRIRLTAFDCIPGFVTDGVTNKTVPWKWNWFQGCRLDIYPTPPQKSLIKLIKHEHIAKNEYQKTHLAIMDNPGNDLYLSAPQIEIDPRESVQMQARGGSVMSSAANEVKPEDQVKQNVGVIPPQQTTRDYVASMPRKVDTVSMQTHRDTPSSMSSDPNVHFEQKPNVAMLKQAMNTATPPTMNPSTSQQIMQQQDMHYDAQGLDSKGSIGMLPGPEPISKTRGTRKRNSGNSTRGGGGVRQRRTNSKTQDKDQPLVPGTSTGGMGPGPQGYHPQQQQQMQHGWQGQQTAGYQPGQMYQAPQPGAGQMGGSSMPQGSHTMGYGPLPTGHQAQPPTHPQPMTTQAHIQQSMQQQAMQSQSQQPLADQQQIHMQHASTHHASHPQHAQQSAAAASGGTGQGHTINPEARSKLAKLATDRMQRKDERGGSISGPSGAEAQAAATHQAPPTQTQPIDTTKMRIKQEIVDRQSHTPNTQTQMYQQQQQAQSQQQQQHFNIKQEYGANNMGQPLPQASSGGGFAQGQRTSATNIHQQQQQHYQSQAQQSQQQPNAPVSHSGPGMGQVGPQPRNQQGQFSSRSDLESSNYSAHMQTSQPQASHQMHLQQGHQTQAAHGAMPQQQQQQQQQRQMGPGAGRQQMTQSQQQQLAMMQQQRQAQAGFQGQQGNYGAGHYDMQGQQGMSGSDQMSHQQGGPQQASQQQIGGAYPQHPQMQQQQQQQYYQQQQMMGGYQGDHPANMQQAQQQRAQMAQQQQFRQGAYGNQGMMQQQQHNYQGNPNQGYQR